MPFQIIRNDITKVRADAIVDTANPNPIYGGGTDAAIYKAAGAEDLLAERKKIGSLRPGEAAVTPAFGLKARFIIHTVGPVWQGGDHQEYDQLASCYRKSLLLARQLDCSSIAFPLISTGVYGFPRDRALDTALQEISSFLQYSEMDITLVVFDRKAFDLSSDLVSDVSQYIDEHYVKAQEAEEYSVDSAYFRGRDIENGHPRRRSISETIHRFRSGRTSFPEQEKPARAEKKPHGRPVFSTQNAGSAVLPDEPADSLLMDVSIPYTSSDETPASAPEASPSRPRPQRNLDDVLSQVGESFQACLLRLIDEHGFTDAEVYKRANIDRKLFSKIRCNKDYIPKRKTVISLAIALEPNMDEMTDLLQKAGIALSPMNKFDLIIRYCVENRIYDPIRINALLFDYDQEMLGA
jgi:O-acetyl-ADP-ribose deacetylase (regulator of RNase III)